MVKQVFLKRGVLYHRYLKRCYTQLKRDTQRGIQRDKGKAKQATTYILTRTLYVEFSDIALNIKAIGGTT